MLLSLTAVARLAAFASGLALFVAAVRLRARPSPTAGTFSVLLGMLAGSALLFAAVAAIRPAYELLWLYALLALPLALAAFALDYAGIQIPDRALVGAAALPALVGAAAGTVLSFEPDTMDAGGAMMAAMGGGTDAMGGGMNGMNGMGEMTLPGLVGVGPLSLSPLATAVVRALREVGIYYAAGATLVGVTLVAATVLRYDHLDTGLGLTLAFVGGWPWLTYAFMPVVATAAGWSTSLATIGGGYVMSLGAVALAAGPYGLFESEPAAGNVGPAAALEAMAEAVLVVAADGHVLRVNAAAEEAFGVAEVEAVGHPLRAVIGREMNALTETETVDLATPAGSRRFEPTVSAVAGRTAHERGYAVVLRDVTERETREQRLQVLNRVLRHNFRNDLNVIQGHADIISDGGVEPERGAETIRDTADRLMNIGERAREVEHMMSIRPRPDTTSDVAAAVTETMAAVGKRYPDVEFSTAAPDDAVAAADRRVLDTVLENVVENAAEHNDAEAPLVVATVDRTDGGWLRVAVSDNGPGIPAMERTAIQTGTEDPLEHSTGLGLWAVRWGVQKMGGDLSFAENDPRGTVVRIELPPAEPP